MGLREYNPFGSFGQRTAMEPDPVDVHLRADDGAVTPLPPGYGVQGYTPLGNSAVDVFNGRPDPRYARGGNVGYLPQYGGGVLAPSDSSVTIFSLDGAGAVNTGQNYNSGGFTGGQNYTSSYGVTQWR